MLGTRGPRSTRGSVSGVILLAEPGFAGADDGLCPVGDLELGEDVRDVVGYRLGIRAETSGERSLRQCKERGVRVLVETPHRGVVLPEQRRDGRSRGVAHAQPYRLGRVAVE